MKFLHIMLLRGMQMHMCMLISKSCKRKQSACLVCSSSACSCLPWRAWPKIEHRKELVHTFDGLAWLGVNWTVWFIAWHLISMMAKRTRHIGVMCENMKNYKSFGRRDDYGKAFFKCLGKMEGLIISQTDKRTTRLQFVKYFKSFYNDLLLS